jgi:hypothetical protein
MLKMNDVGLSMFEPNDCFGHRIAELALKASISLTTQDPEPPVTFSRLLPECLIIHLMIIVTRCLSVACAESSMNKITTPPANYGW